MRKFSGILKVLSVAALALITAGHARAADDILIGYHGPLTGPASWIGLSARDGAALAVQEINAGGGVDGRKLKLISYDDANKPSEGEAVAKKMIESDKVFAILGGGASNTAVVVAGVATQEKVPYLNGVGSTPKILDLGSRWVFTGATIDARDIAENETAFIGTYLKSKNVAFIHAAEEVSVPLVDAMVAQLKDKYSIATVARQTYNRGDTDYSSQLVSIQQAKPDLLVLSGPYIETARIVRQARELGIKLPIKADTGAMNTGLLTIAGPAAEGLYVSYIAPYFNGDPADNMVKFEARYKKTYSGLPADRPNFVDMDSYGNMYSIAEALKRAGPNTTQNSFVDALETLDQFNASTSWPGAVDVIQPTPFAKNHDGNRRMSQFVVKNGAFTRVAGFTAPVPSAPLPPNDSLRW